MTKRVLCCLIAIAMIASIPALAQTYCLESVFVVEYPDDWYPVPRQDDSNARDGNVVLLCGPGVQDLNVDITLLYEPQWADVTLYHPGEDVLSSFRAYMLEDWAYTDPVYQMELITQRDELTFLILRGTDEYGDYILAETVANGWRIQLMGYAYQNNSWDSCRALTQADCTQFETILRSFAAIRN